VHTAWLYFLVDARSWCMPTNCNFYN